MRRAHAGRGGRWLTSCLVLLAGGLAHVVSNHSSTTTTTTTTTATTTTTTTTATPAGTSTHQPPGDVEGTWTAAPSPQTLRPANCTPPAIEQFPRPLIGQRARKSGAIVVHLLAAVYTFLGLAIVCDDYFVSSLDRICEELKLTPDVAGATFMAAGSSAPELATVVIGVFFAKDDIGVSGVIGSAVFNIMFVIALCGLFAPTVCHLNWWPLIRDCTFYCIAILVMLYAINNRSVSWGESLLMLLMYAVYCVVLKFNAPLERWAQTLPVPCKRPLPEESSSLVSYKHLDEDRSRRPSYTASPPPENTLNFSVEPRSQQPMESATAAQMQPGAGPPPVPPPPASAEYYKSRESQGEEVSPMVMPTDGGLLAKVSWVVTVPIHAVCRVTMPDCKKEKWKQWYLFTFMVSMVWISFYSYIMVWMITIVGSTLGIPDTVMGLTFVAAGVSVPDALSSLAVVKEGYGDMAVSNAVGSNVFDILVCLGLPWFMQTAIVKPGSHVNVYSKGLTYSTLSLLSTILFLVVTTHLNGWKLDKKYGFILLGWYLLFITFASLYELNVFGNLNPLECPTDY
ncbi:probable sodium/potassium/calcium exchanger CG1090 [Bacillus rossius redtenbacheri]|uniref:probable sodium/potassium/calcium exchanger CG1090 n=1 Tax=Bacillus rossius redtenbacheri TaxID=93214 RepID=UPI002FDCC822